MKKIMIVDDNYLSAEGIEKNIDWETLNAEIIHVCSMEPLLSKP